MEHWELAARESIRDLVARYNVSGDAGRFEETLALFAEDAVLEISGGRSYRGIDEIESLLQAAVEPAPERTGDGPPPVRRFIRHFTATHRIDLEDEARAAGCCYYAVLTNAGLDHWGCYVDRYVLRAGRWLFAARTVSVDGAVAGGWGERALQRTAAGHAGGDER